MKKIRGFEKINISEWEKQESSLKYNNIKIPERATSYSAGYDIFSPVAFTLEPGKDKTVPTGIKAYMQDNEILSLFPRSGLGFNYYTRLANTVGIIDSDYYNNSGNEGHIFVKLRNEGTKPLQIYVGDAIAQGIFLNYLLIDGDNFNGKNREGGLGSTST